MDQGDLIEVIHLNRLYLENNRIFLSWTIDGEEDCIAMEELTLPEMYELSHQIIMGQIPEPAADLESNEFDVDI